MQNPRKSLFFFILTWILILASTEVATALMRRRAPHAFINCKNSTGFIGDSTNVSLGFAGGTASQIVWDGSKMVLSSGQTEGTFTSRVIDNSCVQLTPWLNFKWKTTLPFAKELPASSEAASDYSDVPANLLNGIIGIWRFNEVSYNGTPGEVTDSSGNGQHGVIQEIPNWVNTPGRFNRATNRTADPGRIVIPLETLPNNNQTFTFSTWFKSSVPNDWAALVYRGNLQYTAGLANSWSLRINEVGRPYVQIDTNLGLNQIVVFAPTNILDGRWHHLALTVNSSSVSLFLDGTKYTNTFLVGNGLLGDWNMYLAEVNGNMDEAAYWGRVLSDSEIISLYRRGSNRVKIQIRNCTNPDCSDNPLWRGPDNTASTYFTELNNNSNPLNMLGAVLSTFPSSAFSNFPDISITRRYFQYKMILETDNPSYSPDVQLIGPGR